jgi:hypothetical protein
MSEYNEYFTPPRFVVVTTYEGKVQNVFGPFDSRDEGSAYASSQDHACEVVRLTAPVQKKQPVTITFEHSPEYARAVNSLAKELGVSWSEGCPFGGTFVLKGRLNKSQINAFRTRFGQEPWFTFQP